MRFIKNPNITVIVLAIYTAAIYIYFFPRNTEMSSTEKWLTVGASVVMLTLLWFLLRRRNRLRRKREEERQNRRG
jgi:ABC-type nickel/cobalt efflux system permease component RcnA